MTGREEKKENDLFFTCSLIEYIARKTKNKRSATIDILGKSSIEKIYNLADIYHSDNIETVCDDFIQKSNLQSGRFDNVAAAKYAVPSHWGIGKVYKRLILGIAKEKNISIIDALFAAYHVIVHSVSSNTLRDAQIWSILPHIALAASGFSCFRHENASRYSGL